jgi:hypothetical protein
VTVGDTYEVKNTKMTGSAIGSGNVVNFNSSVNPLLEALVDRRDALLRDAPGRGRDEVEERLDAIEAQLRSSRPDKEVVRGAWQRIAAVVGVLSEPVMEITKLIAKFLA